jgi:hypothetical protein
MLTIQNIIKKIISSRKKVLGRWNIDYDDKVVNYKIDMSNEDHCGPCGKHILETRMNEKTKSEYLDSNVKDK